VDFDGGTQSSDSGLLPLREAMRWLRACRRLADAMPDRRDPDRIRHAMFEMVMARATAIVCGHEDAIETHTNRAGGETRSGRSNRDIGRISSALARRDQVEEFADFAPGAFMASLLGFAHEVL
jgi:hypothetical protein